MARVETEKGWRLRHGYTEEPESRATILASNPKYWCRTHPEQPEWEISCGGIEYEPQSVEAGSGWPDGGPPDGRLASGGHDRFAVLDGLTPPNGEPWPAVQLTAGALFQWHWWMTAVHPVRNFRHHCTKDGWNPREPLSRNQFDLDPFLRVDWNLETPQRSVSYWGYLPKGKRGHHVIYSIWEVGDTANSFYQACDVDFG